MNLQIRESRSLVAGGLFLTIGLGALVMARGYSFGNGSRMGPGAFPTVLAMLLTLLGVVGIARALIVEGEPLGRIALKPVIIVTAAISAFAYAIDRAGLVLAIALLVPIASLAGKDLHWRETALVTLALIILSVGIFIYGLGLPFTLFGRH